MVIINNFEIIDGNKIAINVETTPGNFIDSILLWSMYDFKDYNLAVDLSSYLQKNNNKEVLIIKASDINIDLDKELIFMEATSDDVVNTCCNNAVGVTYDLSNFYRCMLDHIFKDLSNQSGCCGGSDKVKDTTINVDLMLTLVEKSLELGLYTQAIDIIEKIRKICKSYDCGCGSKNKGSKQSGCQKFKQF